MNGGETVTLISRVVSGRDGYNNDVFTDASTDVPGCVAWIASTAETTQGGDQVTTGITVLMPPGTAVKPTDRVVFRGDLFDVDGEPFDFASPFTGRRGGVEVHLIRHTG